MPKKHQAPKLLKAMYMLITLLILNLSVNWVHAQGHSAVADSLINKGHNFVKAGEPTKAFDTFFDALAKFDRKSEPRPYFDVLTALTFHLYYTDTYGELYPLEERLRYIDQAISLAVELKEDSIYTNKIHHKGVLYNINESIDSALFYFDKTITWARKINNDNILLQAYYFKSGILRDLGDLDASYELLLEYKREAERIEAPVHIQTVTEALGNFFTTKGEIDKSIIYFKESLEAARKYNMDAYYSLSDLALSYADLDSVQQAIYYLKEADKEIERIKAEDPVDQQYAFKKMSLRKSQGYLYASRDLDLDSALIFFEESLEMAKALNHMEAIVETSENIAQIYDKKGNDRRALEARLENYEMATQVNNIKLRITIEENLARSYEALNRSTEALRHYKNFNTLSDSLLNIEQLELVAKMEAEYDTEKKEQEIALLNEKTKRQNARQNGLIIIGVLLIIVLIVVFLALRSKQKANRLISHQKDALADSNLQLLELSEFKENLTHMIVHDMKNPLNSVIGLSQGEATEKKMHTIAQSGQQMLNMVSNMLDVQKFKEAKVNLNTESHNFYSIFKEARVPLELLMHAKNIELITDIDKRAAVEVDSELVVRILGNLLSNAIKFSQLGGQVEVKAEINDNAQLLMVSITDHGHGLKPEQLKQVFDKYWQGDKEAGYNSSTGLGLTFCKLAVEAHGGAIGVKSTPGQFTTFTFSLPMAEKQIDVEVEEPTEALDRNESLILESDIAILSKYISELHRLKIHQVGKITQIVRQMDQEDVKSPWKKDLVSAMHQGNQARFDELVEMLR